MICNAITGLRMKPTYGLRVDETRAGLSNSSAACQLDRPLVKRIAHFSCFSTSGTGVASPKGAAFGLLGGLFAAESQTSARHLEQMKKPGQ